MGTRRRTKVYRGAFATEADARRRARELGAGARVERMAIRGRVRYVVVMDRAPSGGAVA